MNRRVVSFIIRIERLSGIKHSTNVKSSAEVSVTIWVATRNPFVPYRFWERWDFFIERISVYVKIKVLARKAYI